MEFSGQYLTYNDYRLLGGSLDIMPFNLLELQARKYIDKYTFGRLKNLTSQVQEVKLCMYDLINLETSYQNVEKMDKAIASESTDGYSISYSNSGGTYQAKSKEAEEIIHTYLSDCKLEDNTPYLYRGGNVNKLNYYNLS